MGPAKKRGAKKKAAAKKKAPAKKRAAQEEGRRQESGGQEGRGQRRRRRQVASPSRLTRAATSMAEEPGRVSAAGSRERSLVGALTWSTVAVLRPDPAPEEERADVSIDLVALERRGAASTDDERHRPSDLYPESPADRPGLARAAVRLARVLPPVARPGRLGARRLAGLLGHHPAGGAASAACGAGAGAISLVMAARIIPGFFFGPVAGVLVDRWDRKTVDDRLRPRSGRGDRLPAVRRQALAGSSSSRSCSRCSRCCGRRRRTPPSPTSCRPIT